MMIRNKLLIIACCLFTWIGYACDKEDDAFLQIDNKNRELTFNSNGETLSIPVNSNYSFSTSLPDNVDWCEAAIVGQSVQVTVRKMSGGASRKVQLSISSRGKTETVTICQETITVNQPEDTVTLTNDAPGFDIEITAAVAVKFDYPDWIRGVDIDWEDGTKSYFFEAEPYFGNETSRSGTVTISSVDPSIGFTSSITITHTVFTNEAIMKLNELWRTSPFEVNATRIDLMRTMENYSVLLPHNSFQSYLTATPATATGMEKENPILSNYRHAFDFVLSQARNETVEEGTTLIWLLYNMGFIIKTPSVCFGIDINHRYAEQLEPYLDFICVTHNHADHKSIELMDAMHRAGKPVLSNFYTASRDYHATSAANYVIGNVRIRTNITDHDAILKNFTTVYRIEAGNDSGNFDILHCGDSSFDPSQYLNVDGGSPSLLVLRSSTRTENNIIGTGNGQVSPQNVFLSHLIELRHRINESPMRFTIMGTLENRSNISVENTFVPFWGERSIWKDGKFQK